MSLSKPQLLELMHKHLDWWPMYGIEGQEALADAILAQTKSLREALQIGLEAQEESINLYIANYGEKYRPARLKAMRAGMKQIEVWLAALSGSGHPAATE